MVLLCFRVENLSVSLGNISTLPILKNTIFNLLSRHHLFNLLRGNRISILIDINGLHLLWDHAIKLLLLQIFIHWVMLIYQLINLTIYLFLRHLNGHTVLHFELMLEVWYFRIVNINNLLLEILATILLIWIIYLVLSHFQRVLTFSEKYRFILMQSIHWKFNYGCIKIFHILLENGMSALHCGHTIWWHAFDLLTHWGLNVDRLLLFLTVLYFHHGLLVGIHHHFWRERVDHLVRILNKLLVHLVWVNNILLDNLAIFVDDFVILPIKVLLDSLLLLPKDFLFI